MISRKPNGFTLIELLIVVTIVGIVALAVAPTSQRIMERNAVRSAKQEIAAMLTVARASALHNGRRTRFVRTGNSALVRLERGVQWDTIARPANMMRSLKVSLQTAPDTIAFDSRGFAMGVSNAYQIVQVTRGATIDSVCVTRFGRIITEGRCN
jgi:prepilin-type N-terminal cleavage/methylation domain-containing protein